MVKMLPMPASMLPFHPLPYRRKQRKMPLIRPKPFSKKKQTKRPSKLRLSLNMQKQKANQKTLTKKKLFRKRQKKWLLMLPKKNQRKKRRKLKF